ncbi:MAG: hypothetical protein KDB71_13775, partial [Mycobacterium sp.]|nr:hypothetical protein [Mycobacterium sp.]
ALKVAARVRIPLGVLQRIPCNSRGFLGFGLLFGSAVERENPRRAWAAGMGSNPVGGANTEPVVWGLERFSTKGFAVSGPGECPVLPRRAAR